MRVRNKYLVFNMAQAASRMGVGLEVLRRAKKAGCSAFLRNGSVHVDVAEKWIAEHSTEMSESLSDSLKDQKLREEVRKLKLSNDFKADITVERSKVAEKMQKIIGRAIRTLEQKLLNEYPSAVAGLEPEAARVYGRRVFDSIVESMRKFGSEWEEN